MNEQLYDNALDAIMELFKDTSLSQQLTKDSLESLISEIDTMIESLHLD